VNLDDIQTLVAVDQISETRPMIFLQKSFGFGIRMTLPIEARG
jgi:hypothetical protein